MARLIRGRSDLGDILKGAAMQAMIRDEATQVARAVRMQGLTAKSPGDESSTAIVAEVEMSVTDRAHASVVIKHPAGEGMQAKHGVLTRAAAAAGLEVKQR